VALKLKSSPVPKLRSVDGMPTSVGGPSPYLGGLSTLGQPGISAVRAAAQTAGLARKAVREPVAPSEPVSPISKIRVRRKRFRYAPMAPAGGFNLPTTKY
jgi:hypothetical protein